LFAGSKLSYARAKPSFAGSKPSFGGSKRIAYARCLLKMIALSRLWFA